MTDSDGRSNISHSTSTRGTGLRSRWLVLLGIGLTVTIAVIATREISRPSEQIYHAEALVVANELAIRVESLPRTAVAIFNSSSVAEQAAELAGTGIDPDYLIREIVNAEPVENTNVIEVDALHTDPELTAAYANAAGEALVQELNRIGAGLGSFSLHVPAEVPDAPVPTGRLQLLVAALMAGAAAAIGAASLYLVWSGVDSKHDDQGEPTAPHPPVSVDSIEDRDLVVHVPLLERNEKIGGSTEDHKSPPRQQQLNGVMENPDRRRDRWLAALKDIRSLNGTQPSEPSLIPSETAEPDELSAADNENAPDDAVATKGGSRHPQTARPISGDAPTHKIHRPSSHVVSPGSADPPTT